ncbi:TetR/AcrR family transcriptional regulator [Amycolatopsis jiangsuensis]|uniref:AcrR family transcriptional regulator n=1 Tax=Amycolatopsis jiangsuensis TaxID=1181879 RepID=A0A840IY94_9PSEU|nr:TetR/AcrR family transcriptional regulator [Amycolatopsis jiangsuensis]MBB4687636.1 AcrR family transcriptional regulator [Amycolatopsis jiangsuensis]
MPAAGKTARERVRAELTREIKDEARRQLADVGAHGLSLRAVARELGMVSSALYRYFSSRDQLLTALIIDAYNAVGEAAERADPGHGDPRGRWRAIWHATRNWARAHPHEYALIFGSPIPGYQAPQDTVGPAARMPMTLMAVLRQAHPDEPAVTAPMSAELRKQAGALGKLFELDAPAEIVTRAIAAWTQLYGAISFELFGQYANGVDPADAYFEHLTGQMADFVGL